MEYRNLQRVKDAPKLFLEPDNEIVMPQIEYKRVRINYLPKTAKRRDKGVMPLTLDARFAPGSPTGRKAG